MGKLSLGQQFVAYGTCGNIWFNRHKCRLHYYYIHVMLCAWYYTLHSILYIAQYTTYHAAYNNLESKLPAALFSMFPSTLWSTLQIALNCTHPASLTVHSKLLSMVHSQPAWLMISSKLSSHSQVHCEYIFNYTPQHAHTDAPNPHSMAHYQLTLLYAPKSAPKILSDILSSILLSTLPIALDDTLLA